MKQLYFASVCMLVACGDPIERNIAAVIEGGEGGEQAKMELNLAKGEAVGPLIRAFGDHGLPARARVDLAGALYRLYLRENDPAIFASLVEALADPEPTVRVGVAMAIGSLRKREAVAPLLHQLDAEADAGVQREILTALELMSVEGREIRTSLRCAAGQPHPHACGSAGGRPA